MQYTRLGQGRSWVCQDIISSKDLQLPSSDCHQSCALQHETKNPFAGVQSTTGFCHSYNPIPMRLCCVVVMFDAIKRSWHKCLKLIWWTGVLLHGRGSFTLLWDSFYSSIFTLRFGRSLDSSLPCFDLSNTKAIGVFNHILTGELLILCSVTSSQLLLVEAFWDSRELELNLCITLHNEICQQMLFHCWQSTQQQSWKSIASCQLLVVNFASCQLLLVNCYLLIVNGLLLIC